MGIYLNPGNENFKRALAADIYVDKTQMLAVTNRFIDKANNYVCISRPRRFGKTITGNMLAAYYSRGCDSKGIFSGLDIGRSPEFEKKLNAYNVIQIDMNSEYQNAEDHDQLIKTLLRKLKREIREQFADIHFEEDILADMLLRVYTETGQTSSYEAISERIRMNVTGLKEDVVRMLAGERVEVNVTRFMNTMNSFKTKSDVFTYLIHLGYLAYDKKSGTCGIPNREVRQEWLNAIEEEKEYEINEYEFQVWKKLSEDVGK